MPAALLLPGLDGSARLFGRLIAGLGAGWATTPVAYPPDRALDLPALAEHALARRPAGPYLIVAESFSGPVALEMAARDREGMLGIVLVATFVSPPVGGLVGAALRHGSALAARLPVPRRASAAVLTAGDLGLAREIDGVLAPLRPEVLALRLRVLASLDVRAKLVACPLPMLVLAGSRDRLVGRDKLEEIRALRPDLVVRELDAPHLVLQVQAERAAREIAAFAASLGAS